MDTSFLRLYNDRKIIICVDDFGLNMEINQAVINLAEQGKVNATSVLVDSPNLSQDFIEQALVLKHHNKLSLGLHLNFTTLFSSHQDEELIDPFNTLLIKSKFFGKKKIEAIYKEIERQFELFENLFDCWPDYIDGYKHVHMLPGFFEALRLFYTANRLDQNKIWVRSLNRVVELNKTGLKGSSKFKNLMLRLATKKARSIVYSQRKELLGVNDFDVNEQEFTELFRSWQKKAVAYCEKTGRGVVIMVHPACPINELDPKDLVNAVDVYDSIANARLVEYKAFTNLDLNYNS